MKEQKLQDPQSEDRGDRLATKLHILKVIDQDVIHHLKDIREDDFLNLVHSALKERVHRILCWRFFAQAKLLKNGNVDVSIFSKCSQDPDLMTGVRDWARAFESFVLTTQMRSYKVTVDHIQIGTRSILQGPEKSKTVEKLVNDNTFSVESLRTPADIDGICWNTNIDGLRLIESTLITITFSNARQANGLIEQGFLWNHERRFCRRQGAHPRITQCGHCQAYGHISKDCSSAPRCHVCPGLHVSKTCTHDPAANEACLKCALCGGIHDATSESCKSSKVERQRLQLENRFYPTGAEKAEQGETASPA